MAMARVAPEKTHPLRVLPLPPYAGIVQRAIMSNYYAKLKDPRWQKKRLEILSRDSFTCRLCDDKESTLHVHHIRYAKGADPWDYPDDCLVTLCESCHEEMHIVKIGDRLLESLIVGGAFMNDLFGIMAALDGQFCDGPNKEKLNREQWSSVEGGIAYLFIALKRGATESQIRDALESIGKSKSA
jgi:hypothetical protein